MIPSSTVSALLLVALERENQIENHAWSERHDDRHEPSTWGWLIGRRASDLACPFPEVVGDDHRRLLVEIAAIAVAGIESIDRKQKEQS